ncbi:hypothetical protein N0V83_006446 [Neocucurbitaria cava]|uniref:Uncharacterized protein n=1 Tax=Neocucurbitaria cava TaxID=798079 RepID=A0A9W8Y531_9PLEO|nr:hypothetical protein N0V83_006446 [Neocucurbitaria cava]
MARNKATPRAKPRASTLHHRRTTRAPSPSLEELRAVEQKRRDTTRYNRLVGNHKAFIEDLSREIVDRKHIGVLKKLLLSCPAAREDPAFYIPPEAAVALEEVYELPDPVLDPLCFRATVAPPSSAVEHRREPCQATSNQRSGSGSGTTSRPRQGLGHGIAARLPPQSRAEATKSTTFPKRTYSTTRFQPKRRVKRQPGPVRITETKTNGKERATQADEDYINKSTIGEDASEDEDEIKDDEAGGEFVARINATMKILSTTDLTDPNPFPRATKQHLDEIWPPQTTYIAKAKSHRKVPSCCDTCLSDIFYDTEFRNALEIEAFTTLSFYIPDLEPWDKLEKIPEDTFNKRSVRSVNTILNASQQEAFLVGQKKSGTSAELVKAYTHFKTVENALNANWISPSI